MHCELAASEYVVLPFLKAGDVLVGFILWADNGVEGGSTRELEGFSFFYTSSFCNCWVWGWKTLRPLSFFFLQKEKRWGRLLTARILFMFCVEAGSGRECSEYAFVQYTECPPCLNVPDSILKCICRRLSTDVEVNYRTMDRDQTKNMKHNRVRMWFEVELLFNASGCGPVWKYYYGI